MAIGSPNRHAGETIADAAAAFGKAGADFRVERSLYDRTVGYSYDAVKIFMSVSVILH